MRAKMNEGKNITKERKFYKCIPLSTLFAAESKLVQLFQSDTCTHTQAHTQTHTHRNFTF